MGMFDQVARFLCKLDGNALFPWLLRDRPDLCYSFEAWDDSRRLVVPGQPDRVNDLVAILSHPDPNEPPARVVVEVMAEAQRFPFPRLGVYELTLLQELDAEAKGAFEPPILLVLMNLTGENPVGGWRSRLGSSGVWPVVVNLRNESAPQLLDDIEAGRLSSSLLPWAALMRDGDESVIQRWKALAAREANVERRRQYRDFALIFAELSKRLVLWQRGLEGWEMQESQLILGWINRGREEGEVKRARAFVLDLIAARFEQVPEDLTLAVEGTNDLDILSRWHLAAGTTTSIAKLRKAMKKT